MTMLDNTDVRDRTLTALFDTKDAAQRAVDDLVELGISREHVSLTGGQSSGSTATPASHDHEGFWESLKDIFMPEEDRYAYAEGLRRGGYLVVAHTDEANYARTLDVLDREGSVDLEERETSWRSEGWTGYQAGAMPSTGAKMEGGSSASRDTTPLVAPATGSVGAASASGNDEVVPIYEEKLNIGKRDVSHGKVRLRSFVVETPVSQQVELRRESVAIDRRPVDRPIEAGDAMFKDRVIEAEERSEEAVVSKSARVIEEISLRKTADTESRTVSDSVRKTEVEIQDDRTRQDVGAAVEPVPGSLPQRKI